MKKRKLARIDSSPAATSPTAKTSEKEKPKPQIRISAPSPRTSFREDRAVLRFSPKSWGKIMMARDRYSEEIAAFGISSEKDLLLVEDIWIPKQTVSGGSFEFDDDDVADRITRFFLEEKIEPFRTGRIWIHTHPAGVAGPSGIDEETFTKVFGDFSWQIMAIFPKGSPTPYAALKINAPGVPLIRAQIPVEPDYCAQGSVDLAAFSKEIAEKVSAETYFYSRVYRGSYFAEKSSADLFEKDFTDPKIEAPLGLDDERDEEFWWHGECHQCGDFAFVDDEGVCRKCCANYYGCDPPIDIACVRCGNPAPSDCQLCDDCAELAELEKELP